LSTTLQAGIAVPVAKQPYSLVNHTGVFQQIDTAYATGISYDKTWTPTVTYKLFSNPELVITAPYAYASGLWRFMNA